MIYDCFLFFNELELLELRFHELNDVVDKFVLVEATRTFTNLPKPLYFSEHRSHFDKFKEKIIHVVIEDSPDVSDAWLVDNFQRDCIARGLTHCRPEDWILISDLDEIPRPAMVKQTAGQNSFPRGFMADGVIRPAIRFFSAWEFTRGRARRTNPFIFKFQQSFYRHFINCKVVGPPSMARWFGTRMLFYRDFSSAQLVRHSGYKIVENGGWHFTSMGGTGRIVKKIQSFAHQEFNYPEFLEKNRIEEAINQGKSLFEPKEELKFVPVDDSYPRYILEHPEKFSGWIKKV